MVNVKMIELFVVYVMNDDSSNKEFSCAGGSTGSFGRHLKVIHNVGRTIQNQ
ncbi:Uncharacterized protein FWK35_00039003, partial [Aphis craccivora]